MKNLQPEVIWKYFNEITKVPRPSKHEGKIIDYLIAFATKNSLEYKQDQTGNIVIIRQPSEGYENIPGIILQSHMDMVCEKNDNIVFDFMTQGIRVYTDGDWVKARGTTLGADCGIGMAAALAVLVSDLRTAKIEALFTVDEETGLSGALGLDPDILTGQYLINLDSEDEGEIFIGCAGGIDTIAHFNYSETSLPDGYKGFRISITGLSGGHSGNDINKGLGNSIKIINRFLWEASKKYGIRLAVFNGGNLRNAIPREAYADFALDNSVDIIPFFEKFKKEIFIEYSSIEKNIDLDIEEIKIDKLIDNNCQSVLLNSIYAVANGVISMSHEIKDLVETSTNLASVKFKENNIIEIVTSQRSSSESKKYDAMIQVESAFMLAGAHVSHSDGYPGWSPQPESHLLKIAQRSYYDLYGNSPDVKAVHAGLECGLFLKKYPELQTISIGPTMMGVHSPNERLYIPSVSKFWGFLLAIIKNIY